MASEQGPQQDIDLDLDEDGDEGEFDPQLLELEPLREDSEDLPDSGTKNGESSSPGEDDDEEGDENDENEEGEDDDSEEHEDGEETAGNLNNNEQQILQLLSVDRHLVSVLDMAADALSSLRPTASDKQDPSEPPADALKSFEAAATKYYDQLDLIHLTLRDVLLNVRQSRISPRLLVDNPPPGSVLTGGPGANKDDRVSIAPGVPHKGSKGLGRGAQRMEIETYREAVKVLKELLATQAQNPT